MPNYGRYRGKFKKYLSISRQFWARPDTVKARNGNLPQRGMSHDAMEFIGAEPRGKYLGTFTSKIFTSSGSM